MSCTFGIGRQIRLPVFHDDTQREEPVDGYDVLAQPYLDGVNKLEIQPLRYDGPAAEGYFRPLVPVGQPYTIGQRHLTRIILEQS